MRKKKKSRNRNAKSVGELFRASYGSPQECAKFLFQDNQEKFEEFILGMSRDEIQKIGLDIEARRAQQEQQRQKEERMRQRRRELVDYYYAEFGYNRPGDREYRAEHHTDEDELRALDLLTEELNLPSRKLLREGI